VSSWVHDMINGHPELSFAVLYVGSYPGAQGEPRYQLPSNVVALHRVYCQDSALAPLDGAGRSALREQIRSLRNAMEARAEASRVLAGLQRMHVEGEAGTDVLAALASNDLTLPELLHGRPSFQLLTTIAERVAPEAPFRTCSGTTGRSSRPCCACSRPRRCRRAATTRSPPATRGCWRRCGATARGGR